MTCGRTWGEPQEEDWTGLGLTPEQVAERVGVVYPNEAAAEKAAAALESAGFTVLPVVLPLPGLRVVPYASVYHWGTMRLLGRVQWRASLGRVAGR